MGRCEDCGQDMAAALTCVVDHLHQGGRPVMMVRYGKERRWPNPSKRCGDCGVGLGGYHHLGCDIQECPLCGRQLLSCGCAYDERERDQDDGDFRDD